MWPEVRDIHLPGWIPRLTLRETAWVRHGFLLPFRAAHSKPKREQGISCRWENIDLRVRVMPLGDSLICSAVRLQQCLITVCEGNISWVFGCRCGHRKGSSSFSAGSRAGAFLGPQGGVVSFDSLHGLHTGFQYFTCVEFNFVLSIWVLKEQSLKMKQGNLQRGHQMP